MNILYKFRVYILAVVFFAMFLAAGFETNSNRSGQTSLFVSDSKLTFSSTQVWDPEFTAVLENGVDVIERYKPQLTMDPPPSSVKEIDEEIALLYDYVELRTPDVVDEIRSELELEQATFNGQTLTRLLIDKPKTADFTYTALKLISPVEVAFKEEFDRVRPSYYDPMLSTVIYVPGHPAYPSYHAAESMLFALLFSLLDPENTDSYVADAKRIAHNREIAGVHYPSDSTSGQKLAYDFFNLIEEEDWFKEKFAAAQTEW